MAIDAYTGLPRSGKSYSVVKNVILPSLKEGRQIYTNIPLTPLAHETYPGQIHQLAANWFTDLDLADSFPAGAVVVLDELWRRWPSGLKANNANFKDKEFLAEHGHNVNEFGQTTRVILVSQDLSQIAAFARDLVSVTYRTTKLDAVGANDRFRVDIYQGAVTGQNPPKSKLNRSEFDKYDEQYYKWYLSSTKSLTGNVGDESRADKRNNIWRSKFMWFCIIGPVVGIPLALYFAYSTITGGFGAIPDDEPEPSFSMEITNPGPQQYTADQPPTVQTKSQPSRPQGPALSALWRVSGYISSGTESDVFRKDFVVLASHMAGLRRLLMSDCELLPDGYSYKCLVDGEIATPWTGGGEFTQWASKPLETFQRTGSVASGATHRTSSMAPVTNPQPPPNL